jgi:DNA-binding NtrC family response regulator
MKKTVVQKEPAHLLIAEDEPSMRRVLEAVFGKEGYTVHLAENGLRAMAVASKYPLSVMITDLIMPGMNGIDLLKRVRELHPNIVSVVVTAFGTIKTAVDAIRIGADDYITKPFDVDEIRAIVARAVARRNAGDDGSVETNAAENANGQEAPASSRSSLPVATTRADGARMVEGMSAAMTEVFSVVRRAAASRATVLIRGESGTGKELIARALHNHSARAGGPFVAVSCAALTETLLESELFGHEKNSFTGAAAQRMGRFELADKGTLFLDEIGDISPSVQIKLLRVLQERAFERVGGVKTIKVDVRVVAATNADLEALVREGRFRSDLYYRLHVIQIQLPSLRERADDIPLLAAEFLRRFAAENERDVLEIAPDALAILRQYPWPGNVRELENVMERCVVMADHDATVLSEDMLPTSVVENAMG